MRLVTDSPDRMAHLVAISRQRHAISGNANEGAVFLPRLTQAAAGQASAATSFLQSLGFSRATPATLQTGQENGGCVSSLRFFFG